MRVAIHRHLMAAVLAVGMLLGLGQAPAEASVVQPTPLVQTIQYYGAGPGYYRGPPRRFYRRPHYYGRPIYRPGPRFYGPRGRFYGRPHYGYRGYR